MTNGIVRLKFMIMIILILICFNFSVLSIHLIVFIFFSPYSFCESLFLYVWPRSILNSPEFILSRCWGLTYPVQMVVPV